MKARSISSCVIFLFVLAMCPPAAAEVLPSPQYSEPVSKSVRVAAGGTLRIVVGPSRPAGGKLGLAVQFLQREIAKVDSSVKVQVESGAGRGSGAPAIYVWNYEQDSKPPVALNVLDRKTLTESGHFGQSYIIATPDDASLWIVGASEQGALFGSMTALQLIHGGTSGVEISGVYIRDYPDFEFRAAADWLLNIEINRWAFDRAQGVEAFARLCERKLDEALRYKINMVVMDGFGWGLKQRFAGYGELMRRLNGYARARGMHLVFGGYGASYGMAYQTGPSYEEGAYLGEAFKNRESYPDGPVYRCMGFPQGRQGVDPATLGSCRGNEDLNHLKAAEIRAFVEAVEPGALYIHHEDFGGYHGTAQVWRERCPRCRARWPNDSLAASDGGAGGLANGYSALIRAVNSVKNPATGYDASRDCQIILVSPVYLPDSPSSQDWSDVLELWQNIGTLLPKGNNVQVCIREVFPQLYGGAQFIRLFDQVMKQAGLNLGVWLFFSGGADNYFSDYPTSGVPTLNALFRGARSMYNAIGDIYQEPMEIVNAQFTWNTHSTGFGKPLRSQEAVELWHRYIYDENQPPEVFAKDGLFDKACNLLYGPKAGPVMASYYRESAWLPDREPQQPGSVRARGYLPETFNRAYAVPTHWRHLSADSKTWSREITNASYARAVDGLKIERRELHRRLARRWRIVAELNTRGEQFIEKALGSNPLPESLDDLGFLQTSFRVYQPFTEALAQYHGGLEQYFAAAKDKARIKRDFEQALAKAKQAQELAARSFPRPVDPMGGEVGLIRTYSTRLVEAIEEMIRGL